MRRHLALVTLAATAACGTTHHAPTIVEEAVAHEVPHTDHRIPEPTDPTAADWDALARLPKPRATRSRQRTGTAASSRAAHPSAGGCTLVLIRQRESGGNYAAVSSSGKYRGAYQFDRQTWASVGGTGDPAAASPEEQDARAAELMRQRGSQPWSVCR